MAAEIAQLWPAAEFVSPAAGDPGAADGVATPGPGGERGRRGGAADAESDDQDERAVGQRDQRCERSDRDVDHSRDRGWTARPAPVGEAARPAHQCQRGGDRA